MNIIALLILSQTALARPECTLTAIKAHTTIEDKMAPLLHLTRVKAPPEDSAEEKDERPYTKEISCIMGVHYAYEAVYKDNDGLKAASPSEFPFSPPYKYTVPGLQEPAVLIARREGIEYVTNDHLEKSHRPQDRGLVINLKDYKVRNKPSGRTNYDAVDFIPRDGANLTVIDEDVLEGGFATSKPPNKIEDKDLAKSIYRAAIVKAFDESDFWQKILKSVDRKRMGKALCDCIRVDDKAVQMRVEDAAEKYQIALTCGLSV